MQTIYIKKYKNEEKNFLQKIKSLYRRTFNVFNVKCIDNIIICEIPSLNKPKESKMKSISRKICKKFFSRFRIR